MPTPDEDRENEREHQLRKAEEVRGGDAELKRCYGPGTHGAHELLDRAYVAQDGWTSYVQTHPAALLDPELYAAADRAAMAMYDFYNLVGRKTMWADPEKGP